MNNIEVEIKFLLPGKSAEEVKETVKALPGAEHKSRFFERTTMYDNDVKTMDAVDARLRVRQVGEDGNEKTNLEFCYKRRLKADGPIKKEEEIEVNFSADPSMFSMILDKMGYRPTTSYERYRTTYDCDGLKMTFDEFPFGIIFEIEGVESDIETMVGKLGLSLDGSTLESCDDVYDRLCREKGLVVKDHIVFRDEEMPQL